MSSIKDNKKYHLLNDYEPPNKKIISDGDILIKELALKQCDTNVTLNSELTKAKNFLKATEIVSITAHIKGCNSFADFNKVNDNLNQIEYLKSVELSNEEINFYIDSDKGYEYLYNKHKNLTKEYIVTKLEAIKCKLQEHDQKRLNNDPTNTHANKQLREFGLSIKPGSTETKLLKFALDNNVEKIKNPHVINNIQELNKTLFSTINSEPINISRVRRKARQLAVKSNTKIEDTKANISNCHTIQSSKWDIQELNNDLGDSKNADKVYKCEEQKFYTIKNGKIIKLDKNIAKNNLLTSESQLNIEEIRKIPKFLNYQPGTPSKILYLRNLPGNITPVDLKSLFKNCNENLTYKILDKRLKGRAFVYFPDEISANRAFNELLGIFVRNKPLIIEFGKGCKNDTTCT